MEYIPIIISALMLIVAVLTFVFARGKDHDSQKENNIKMNLKLDQLCNNTNQILLKIDKHDEKIKELETDIAVINRDVKTAFERIDELKKEGAKHD